MSEPKMKLVQIGSVSFETAHAIKEGGGIHGYGTVTKTHISLKPCVSKCSGCRDDFYNGRQNFSGTVCWSLEGAQVVDKVGYSNRHVTYGPDTIMKKTHSCWHGVH